MTKNLFGTDGVRGLANEYPLDTEGAIHIGKAVALQFAGVGDHIAIGYDPRESSKVIVASICKGLVEMGINVIELGVITTPGLAYTTREGKNFKAGIMVTASHNPYQYNGVKVFDANGDKLSSQIESRLNELIQSNIESLQTGSLDKDNSLVSDYINFLLGSVRGLDLSGKKIAIDCANGSASDIAEKVFKSLKVDVIVLSNKPDGRNINQNCGATDTSELQKIVVEQQCFIGIAFDGDADRVIMVDNLGREVKGDYILYILALANGIKDVVATVMSNIGFEKALQNKGINLIRTDVGDHFVIEKLKEDGLKLGGEASGHIVLFDILATGDGILAAVQTLKALSESGKTLAEWCQEVRLVPQAIENVELIDKTILERAEIKNWIESKKLQLPVNGRILIRPSGTEPVVRIMVEAENAETLARDFANELKELLEA